MLETRRLLCALFALLTCLAAACGEAELPRPELALQRDVTRQYVRAGSSTTIVYRVENPGPETLENVRVTDPLCGAVSGPETLAAGEYRVYTVTAAITGECRSAPTATWTCKGQTYQKTLESVAISLADDRLSVSLSADASEAPAGGEISLKALIKNEGNTPLRSIALDDEKLGPLGVVAGPLAPGGEQEFSFRALLTGGATFRVTAPALSVSGETVSASSNGVTVLLSPEEGSSRLSLRAEAASEAVSAPGNVDVQITLVNSGGGDIGSVTVSELRAGPLRTLAALGPGETQCAVSCPLAETGEMQFLAEYADAPGSTAIVFSAPVRVEIRPDGNRPSSPEADPLQELGAPRRLSEGRSAYAMFVWGMLWAFALLAAALAARAVVRRRRRRLQRERRIRHMRVLRRNARMDEAEWVRTRPHKPLNLQEKE